MKTILIIDDDQDLCEDLAERITSMGHQSIAVHCVNDALAFIEKSDTAIDLILLDLGLPLKLEGPTRRENGLNLLERIVAKRGAPPVIVITSHGKGNHHLCREVMQQGARGFIGKPFDKDPPEVQIKRFLANGKTVPFPPDGRLRQFEGGELIVHASHIELLGVDIGCTRAKTIIRRVITALSPKPGSPTIRMSAEYLSKALGLDGAQKITAAINDFRNKSVAEMRAASWDCGKQDIIETGPGGGYRFKEWITVREGLQEPTRSQTDVDADLIVSKFAGKSRLTHRQINDGVGIPVLRVKAALSRLTELKRVKHVSGTGATTTYEVIPAR